MSYPTIPNVYVSGNTLIASDVNENFEMFENAISDGLTDVNIYNLGINNSANVASSISINTAIMNGKLDITSDSTFQAGLTFNKNMVMKKFGLGAYQEVVLTVSFDYGIAKSSYIILRLASGVCNHLTSWSNFPTSPATFVPEGTIVIMSLSPAAAGPLTINSDSAPDSDFRYGFKLEDSSIVLSSVYDKLIVQLTKDAYTDVLYWHQISFQNNT